MNEYETKTQEAFVNKPEIGFWYVKSIKINKHN